MTPDQPTPVSDTLHVRALDGAALIMLNRPERRNALTPALARALADQIEQQAQDTAHHAVFLRGAGSHFCVGLDLKWVSSQRSGLTPSVMADGLAAFQGVIRAIVDCPLPVVAALEGSVAGIGVDIAAACDLRIADTSLSVHSAFAKMGLVPDGGSTYTLPRLIGHANARDLLMGGSPVSASRALQMGLVSEVAPSDQFDATIADCAGRLAAQSRHSLISIKKLLLQGERVELNTRLQAEGEAQLAALASDEFATRLRAFASG